MCTYIIKKGRREDVLRIGVENRSDGSSFSVLSLFPVEVCVVSSPPPLEGSLDPNFYTGI